MVVSNNVDQAKRAAPYRISLCASFLRAAPRGAPPLHFFFFFFFLRMKTEKRNGSAAKIISGNGAKSRQPVGISHPWTGVARHRQRRKSGESGGWRKLFATPLFVRIVPASFLPHPPALLRMHHCALRMRCCCTLAATAFSRLLRSLSRCPPGFLRLHAAPSRCASRTHAAAYQRAALPAAARCCATRLSQQQRCACLCTQHRFASFFFFFFFRFAARAARVAVYGSNRLNEMKKAIWRRRRNVVAVENVETMAAKESDIRKKCHSAADGVMRKTA